MMNRRERDDEEPCEEETVFDQAGLLSSAHIRRVSSGRCAMLSKTLALCGAFFGLGLAIALPGPATPTPPTDLEIVNESTGQEHVYRCLGFMLGSMLGGVLLDRFNRLFLVFLALLLCAILVAVVPWTGITWLLRTNLISLGATMGFLLTGGNVLCLDLWGRNSGPFMQALHFSFSLGAFLAPLIATPLSPALTTVAPAIEHNRLPRGVNQTDFGFAEGLVVSSLQVPVAPLLNSSTEKPYTPADILPQLFPSSPAKESSAVNPQSTLKEPLNQDNSTVSAPTSSASSRLVHHIPKPKPQVNSGSNLDKSRLWEKVPIRNPPPEDLIPVSSTKGLLSTAASLTTGTQALAGSVSSDVNQNNQSRSAPVTEVQDGTTSVQSKRFGIQTEAEKNSTLVKELPVNQTTRQISAMTSPTPTTVTKVSPSTTEIVVTPSPAAESLAEWQPKSLTLTEKNSSTPSSPPSTSSTAVPLSSSTTTSPEENVSEVTIAPHRHHSKPSSYDNDTEEIHTVMDEVADRFKEYGLSRLQLSYLLVALLLLVVSLLFLGFLCFNPRDPRSRSEEDVGGGRSNIVRPRWVRVTLTTLMMLVLALSAGVQYSYGQLLVVFAMRSPLALSLSTGIALTATFWGAATSTRLACILLAGALSPTALLVFSVALTSAATWLLSALAAQSAAALWVGAVLVAVGTASILPTSFLWMQHHLHISHHVAGMLVMGPAMGEMIFPSLAFRIMKSAGPSTLLHLPALLSLASIALWAAAWRLARHPYASLCSRADPEVHSYQLASQTDEDDLLDLTMSPMTHQITSGSRPYHTNGNGIHRFGT